MLVPALISFPVSNEGTVEKAHPGASTSGFPNRAPRPLNEPTKSPAPGGVLHRVLDTTGHRDAAARVVRDFQPEQLRARCDAVEARDVEQGVPRGDPRDMRAVRVVVEHESERGDAARFAEVGG